MAVRQSAGPIFRAIAFRKASGIMA
jgi:hypothetical protein